MIPTVTTGHEEELERQKKKVVNMFPKKIIWAGGIRRTWSKVKTYKRAAKNTEVLNEFERIESKKFLPYYVHINTKLNYGK